jgi:hypothetical protein
MAGLYEKYPRKMIISQNESLRVVRKRCVNRVPKVHPVQKPLNKQLKQPKGEKSNGSGCPPLLQRWV